MSIFQLLFCFPITHTHTHPHTSAGAHSRSDITVVSLASLIYVPNSLLIAPRSPGSPKWLQNIGIARIFVVACQTGNTQNSLHIKTHAERVSVKSVFIFPFLRCQPASGGACNFFFLGAALFSKHKCRTRSILLLMIHTHTHTTYAHSTFSNTP